MTDEKQPTGATGQGLLQTFNGRQIQRKEHRVTYFSSIALKHQSRFDTRVFSILCLSLLSRSAREISMITVIVEFKLPQPITNQQAREIFLSTAPKTLSHNTDTFTSASKQQSKLSDRCSLDLFILLPRLVGCDVEVALRYSNSITYLFEVTQYRTANEDQA